MNAHIGLAFCVDKIYFAGFIKKNQSLFLDQLGSIAYPFRYRESDFFKADKLPLLANILKTNLAVNPEDPVNLSICIESNLAALKRIILPENINKKEEQEHILWDLSQSLIEPVNQYIFFRTENSFQTNNSRDYLTIAIQKNIIDFFKKICQKNGYQLGDISVNQLVAEVALQNMTGDPEKGLIALFKIGKSRLESTFVWDGNFHSAHYERMPEIPGDSTQEETMIKTMRSKLKQMEILFEQYLQREIKVSRIYLYGDSIADNFLQSLQKHLSVVALRLNPLQNIEKTQRMENNLPALEEVTNYVESIGVVLDQ